MEKKIHHLILKSIKRTHTQLPQNFINCRIRAGKYFKDHLQPSQYLDLKDKLLKSLRDLAQTQQSQDRTQFSCLRKSLSTVPTPAAFSGEVRSQSWCTLPVPFAPKLELCPQCQESGRYQRVELTRKLFYGLDEVKQEKRTSTLPRKASDHTCQLSTKNHSMLRFKEQITP